MICFVDLLHPANESLPSRCPYKWIQFMHK